MTLKEKSFKGMKVARLNDYPWLKYVLIGSMGFFDARLHSLCAIAFSGDYWQRMRRL